MVCWTLVNRERLDFWIDANILVISSTAEKKGGKRRQRQIIIIAVKASKANLIQLRVYFLFPKNKQRLSIEGMRERREQWGQTRRPQEPIPNRVVTKRSCSRIFNINIESSSTDMYMSASYALFYTKYH